MLNHLSYPFKYNWHISEDVAVIGWSYDQDGKLLADADLADFFYGLENEQQFASALDKLNGHFAVVLDSERIQAAAVDHIRSFPILYDQQEEALKFYSSTEGMEISLDPDLAACFIQSWCTPGNRTLDRKIFQLRPGQYLWKEKEVRMIVQPAFYYNHIVSGKSSSSKEELEESGFQALEGAFKRLIGQLGDRPVVVPLSGGYDSRLILAMLHRAGLKNILAYTYGRPNSHEVVIARYIAETLGVDWHFIEYDETLFRTFFTNQWKQYSSANHFLSALPHEQDFFALNSLKEKHLLPDDHVVLPGYCGDLLGGSITSHQPTEWSEEGLRDLIRKKHFNGHDLPTELTVHVPIHDRKSFYDAYQQYFVENKVSKFIVNAVRVYEYFGGDWIMPLWDRELLNFFYSLPYDYREKQKLYNEILFDKIFTPLQIAIPKPGYDDNYANQMKERIKSYLPSALVDRLKRLTQDGLKKDANGLQILNKMIYEHLTEKPGVCPEEINITHAKYFLQNLNK